MYEPLKNPGNQPWKNYVLQHDTTAFHHKSAEIISREVQSKSTGGQTPKKAQEQARKIFIVYAFKLLSSDFKLAAQDFAFC